MQPVRRKLIRLCREAGGGSHLSHEKRRIYLQLSSRSVLTGIKRILCLARHLVM